VDEINLSPRRAAALLLACGALVIAGCGSSSSPSSTSKTATTAASASTQPQASTGQPGPEQVALEAGTALAPASSTLPGTTVNGIKCAPIEQLAYHIHAHLQVYVDGTPRALPGAIGLVAPVAQQTPAGPFYGAQGCYYWLHTHTNDGIIHIESPTHRIYTLGDFFDEWHQPLSANQVASATGPVVVYVNGKKFSGNPRDVKLDPHAAIQISVGAPVVKPQPFSWSGVGL
jgi:hypothetical protein